MARPTDQGGARGSGSDVVSAGVGWGTGIEFAAGVAGMALLGFGLDWWLKTSPWCLLGFATLGIVGAGYNFVRQALAQSRASAARFRAEHPPGTYLRATPDRPGGARDGEPGGTEEDA